MHKIKNIIFDLGGIIINIDYKKTEEAFINLGVKTFRSLYSQFHTTHIFEELEKGNISASHFIKEVQQIAPVPLTAKQIMDAWNAMLLELPAGRLTFLHQLKTRYRTFLLSNTNEIHYDAIQQLYKNRMADEYPLDACFEKAYYSHDLHLRKPDADIFNFVLTNHNLDPAETLFIDDTISNVEGASSCGIQGYYLPHDMTVESLFDGFTLRDHLISSKSI